MSIKDRIDNIAHRVETNNIKLPSSVKLELASICNHKCSFCVVPTIQNKLPVKFMDFNLFKKCVDELYNLKIKELGLSHMGESTLHPQFKECVEYAANKNWFDIFITTNGTRFQELKSCVYFNIKSVKISFNCWEPEGHKKIVGIDDWNEIKQNIIDLINYRNEIKSKTEISISSIYSDNPKQKEFLEYMSNIVDNFYVTQMYNHAGKVNNKIIKPEDSNSVIPNMCNKPCYGLFNLGQIKADGNINLCRFGVDSEFNIGHINEGFENVWFNEKAQKIRDMHLKDKLETCNRCLNANQ